MCSAWRERIVWHTLALQEKQMEALYTLRFLKTQSDRLKVLHYINAMVSMQVGWYHNPGSLKARL
jgi:hypothetical protein